MLPRILKEQPDIAIATLIVSFGLSVWSIYADPVINYDGVRYLLAASDFTNGDWGAGLGLYRWPFYSMLIAITSTLTPLDPELAAHLVNTLLFCLLTVGFLAVVLELGADRYTLLLACLIILLFPGLNKFRPFIIRDAGYLAFYLWSLVYLFRYLRTQRLQTLASWAGLTALAALFRVEVAIFLVLIPLLLLYKTITGRLQRLAIIAAGLCLFALMSVALALWIFGSAAEVNVLGLVGAPLDSIASVWSELKQQTLFRLRTIEIEFLNEFSREYSLTVMVITLLVIVVFESLRRLAFVYAWMAWFAISRKLVLTETMQLPAWLALILGHVGTLCIFTMATFFLDSRYTMALVLTVLLAVPFAARYVLEGWMKPTRSRSESWLFPVMLAFIIGLGLDGLDVRTDKHYIREAGSWLSENVPPDAAIYSNNHLVLHYAGRDALRSGWRYDWQETMSLAWGYAWLSQDFMALEFDRDRIDRRQRIINQLKLEPEIVFSNEEGDNVSVFRIPPEMRETPE